MKYILLIINLLPLLAFSAISTTDSIGLTAYKNANYSSAEKLLKLERKNLKANSQEYFQSSCLIIESLLYTGKLYEAKKELELLKKFANIQNYASKYNMLNCELLFFEKKFDALMNFYSSIPTNFAWEQNDELKTIYFVSLALERQGKLKNALEFLQKSKGKILSLKNDKSLNLKKELISLQIKIAILLNKKEYSQQLLETYKGLIPNSLKLFATAYLSNYKDYRIEQKVLMPSTPINNELIYLAESQCAENAIKAKDFQEAIVSINNAIIASTTQSQTQIALQKLFDIYIEIKEPQLAADTILRTFRLIPKLKEDVKYYKKYFSLIRQCKSTASSIEILGDYYSDKTLKEDIRLSAAKNLAMLFAKENKKVNEIVMYNFIIEFGKSKERDLALLKKSLIFIEEKNYKFATETLNNITDNSDYVLPKMLLLWRCQFEQKQYNDALATLLKILENPDETYHAEALYYRAKTYTSLKELEKALADLETLKNLKDSSSIFVQKSYLDIAKYYLNLKAYVKAALEYQNFAEKYPNNPEAPNARYRAVYFYSLVNSPEEMFYNRNKLMELYPTSPLILHAMFHEADYLKNSDKIAEALKVLENIEKLNNNKDSKISAQILYDRALIYHANNQPVMAIDEIDKLIDKYPSSLKIADGCFLAGSIAFDIGENIRARNYFLHAAKVLPEKNFVNACNGRIADCYFMLFSKTNHKDYIQNAIKIYDQLANNKDCDIFTRSQSLYKLGRSYEQINDIENDQNALFAYCDLIYRALNNENIPALWINKSAKNAINIHLRHGGSNSLREAMQIVDNLRILKILSQAELNSLTEDIKKHYK